MSFLTTLRERLTGHGHGHRVAAWVDPVLGEMEPLGGGLWRTVGPVMVMEGMEPVCVTIDAGSDEHVGEAGRAVFVELQQRYGGMREGIGRMLSEMAPRMHGAVVWEHAMLEGVEVWRDPRTGEAVLALEYVLSDTPEYTYTVRVEGWHAVDVVISG